MDAQAFKNEMYNLLRDSATRMNLLLLRCCEPYGLTVMQFRTLMALGRLGESTVGELGHALGMTSGNISSMCKTLEKGGMLVRCRDSADERIVRLSLTSRGREVIRTGDREFELIFWEGAQDCTEEELERIYWAFRRLNEILNRDGRTPDTNRLKE